MVHTSKRTEVATWSDAGRPAPNLRVLPTAYHQLLLFTEPSSTAELPLYSRPPQWLAVDEMSMAS